MSAASELHSTQVPWPLGEAEGLSLADPAGRRLGVLINPFSWGVRHGSLSALRARLERTSSELPRAYAWNPTTFAMGLDRLAAQGVRVLMIVGGDGTVQGVISALVDGHGAGIVALSLLRGGRSNVTAAKLGATGSMIPSLDRLLHWEMHGLPQPRLQALPTLCVSWGQRRTYGFLLLGGGLVQAVESCRAFREKTGLPLLDGRLGTACWLTRELLRVAMGDGTLRPQPGELLGVRAGLQDYAIMIATTLPNWPGRTQGAGMRVGWVTGRGPRLLGALARTMAGQGSGRHFGWVSQEQVVMRQEKLGYFLLDGEPVGSGQPGDALQIHAGPAVQFLQMNPKP